MACMGRRGCAGSTPRFSTPPTQSERSAARAGPGQGFFLIWEKTLAAGTPADTAHSECFEVPDALLNSGPVVAHYTVEAWDLQFHHVILPEILNKTCNYGNCKFRVETGHGTEGKPTGTNLNGGQDASGGLVGFITQKVSARGDAAGVSTPQSRVASRTLERSSHLQGNVYERGEGGPLAPPIHNPGHLAGHSCIRTL